jgi:hypothetical protein
MSIDTPREPDEQGPFVQDGILYDAVGNKVELNLPPPDPETLSSLISTLPIEERPVAPCCSICPAAYWQRTLIVNAGPGQAKQQLKCRCTAFHEVTYDDGQPRDPITQCDGLDRALKKKHDAPVLTMEDVAEMVDKKIQGQLQKPPQDPASGSGADEPPIPELNR